MQDPLTPRANPGVGGWAPFPMQKKMKFIRVPNKRSSSMAPGTKIQDLGLDQDLSLAENKGGGPRAPPPPPPKSAPDIDKINKISTGDYPIILIY